MMKTPIANSTACRMCAPVSSKPSRIASAQPPANAAPNTSAPIRIAALITVTTLGQTIWRELVGEVCELMGNILFKGRNLYEKGGPIKRKRPQKRPSRDIGSQDRDTNGNCHVRGAAIRRDGARAFPPRLRAGVCRSCGRDRCDHA